MLTVDRPTPIAPAQAPWVSYVLVGCGIVILVLFAATTNVREFGRALGGVRPGVLALAGAALALQILVKAFRWRYMIQRLTGTLISMRFATISIVAGVAGGSIVPARTFEMAKAMLLKGVHGTGLGQSTSAMLVERMMDVVFLIGTLLLAALLLPRRMVTASGALLLTIAALTTAVVLLIAAPLRVREWGGAVIRHLPGPAGLRRRGLELLETFCASILLWREGRTLGTLVGLSALGASLDVARVCAVFWAMGIALSVPLLAFTNVGAAVLGMALLIPGGVGVTEVSQVGLIALLAPGAVPSMTARSAVLVDRFLSYYLLTFIGATLLITFHRYRGVYR